MDATTTELTAGKLLCIAAVEHVVCCGRCGHLEHVCYGNDLDGHEVRREAGRLGWQQMDGPGWLCPLCAFGKIPAVAIIRKKVGARPRRK